MAGRDPKALGASRRDMLWIIVRQGLSPVVLGIAAGLAAGWLARQVMQPVVRQLVPGTDPLLLSLPILLLAVGLLACYLPARRAANVDPNEALRTL